MREGSDTRATTRTGGAGASGSGVGVGAGDGVSAGPPQAAAIASPIRPVHAVQRWVTTACTTRETRARVVTEFCASASAHRKGNRKRTEKARMSPACKPGSVGTPRCTGWSFLSACRHQHAPAAYPRLDARKHPVETGRLSPPIWPCSDRGLPSHARCRTRGGLLPHPFTLTAFSRRRRFAFCCTVRRMQLTPYAPRRYLAICPMEPGLSSEHGRGHEGSFPCFATIRPVTSVPRNISHATNTTPSTTPTQKNDDRLTKDPSIASVPRQHSAHTR